MFQILILFFFIDDSKIVYFGISHKKKTLFFQKKILFHFLVRF